MVDESTLVVTIHRGPASEERLQTMPPPKVKEDRHHFIKTLRACHVRPLKSTRQDIPTAYHRMVGSHSFDGPWYTLSGPVVSELVKSARYYSKKQTFCHFTRRWVDFVALNHVKTGDTVVFSEVDKSEFEVKKV
ncbi:hypothetical protein KC19_VG011500 [Ceratodon purpureus]|uniref:TF-B3 domain-containing protein n=1 Tax=Ceratodon purpureus TaxID=3225 RepID=A0A8T0HKY7_CERPU|nr:hypothetical protein KC19_VG011500 [Ceratodon purpureus]